MSVEPRTAFTQEEIDRIRDLLNAKATIGSAEQKSARSKLRRMGFHIRIFDLDEASFGEPDLDKLIRAGRIRILEGQDKNRK